MSSTKTSLSSPEDLLRKQLILIDFSLNDVLRLSQGMSLINKINNFDFQNNLKNYQIGLKSSVKRVKKLMVEI